ncbi:MAG: ImmA/IrrE family metallo-endopeptidase [Bacteroidetes bacterium]|nr:ImmA/IrrE family metallo-endopeptidase [Bacteroidota bacterium]
MKIEQNISRLKYLLALYKITVDELLLLISKGLKTSISKEDILASEINLSYLKRIDKIFNKGLHYYLDPKSPEVSKDASIFFRKTKFGTDLNIESKRIVNQFEEFKISLSAISKLADLNIERTLPVFTIDQNPSTVARHIRKYLYPEFNTTPKEFLRNLITIFAENNILVLEFVEAHNKKEKVNIDGFFLNPNVIVLKRQQSSFRREIFTLIHELGHYLINEEEIEQLDIANLANNKISSIERWCNDFAYHFLCDELDKEFEKIDIANESNDYHFDLITRISRNTHLSKIALFTRLLFQNKISQRNYDAIKSDFEEQFRKRQEEKIIQKELDKIAGKKNEGFTPKPMNSPLLISTIQAAFYEGVINECDVCKTLKISPDKLEKYLQ